jgi:hypothetical protein
VMTATFPLRSNRFIELLPALDVGRSMMGGIMLRKASGNRAGLRQVVEPFLERAETHSLGA